MIFLKYFLFRLDFYSKLIHNIQYTNSQNN